MARSSPPLFSVSVTDFANGLVLALHGEIDLAAEPTVTGHVETALAQRPATLVLDLGEVTFFDARGLGALIVARQAAARNGCRLELRSLPPIAELVILAAGERDLLALSSNGDGAVEGV